MSPQFTNNELDIGDTVEIHPKSMQHIVVVQREVVSRMAKDRARGVIVMKHDTSLLVCVKLKPEYGDLKPTKCVACGNTLRPEQTGETCTHTLLDMRAEDLKYLDLSDPEPDKPLHLGFTEES